MRRSLLVLIISGISTGAVASGYALWTYMSDPADSVAASAIAPTGGAGKSTSGTKVAAITPPPAALPPGTSSLLAIEVARIEAGGPSVLAGRSPPHHKVTILANGREVASVTATDEGQWSAIVPDGIAAGPLELSITSQPKEGGATVRGATRQLVVPERTTPQLATAPSRPQTQAAAVGIKAPAPRTAPKPIERPQAEAKRPSTTSAGLRVEGEDAANKRALAEFEALVERTRKEMSAQQQPPVSSQAPAEPRVAQAPNATPSPSPSPSGTTYAPAAGPTQTPAVAASPASGSSPPTSLAPQSPRSAQASGVAEPAAGTATGTKLAGVLPPVAPAPPASSTAPGSNPPTPAAVQAPIPVPITFETDEDLLTNNGERAVALLAEYLRLKRPAGITLSGHADARGSDGYNMRLSLKRLKAIERYLRAAGYSGALSLVPRGKREPYRGIDRRHLPLREIYQADRRVELRLTP
jgi:outer membrane protein OmpA-like peptidoglycan-associated protein